MAESGIEKKRASQNQPGALVISLDFELHWGFCDHRNLNDSLKVELNNARRAVNLLLEVFNKRDIHATWAVVGFLMLKNKEQVDKIKPELHLRPQYKDIRLDPYNVPTGVREDDDPYHYASSLVDNIVSTPGQEFASHTFSHYYCLEPGQDRNSFSEDMKAASLAAQIHGQKIQSIVFPRNQYNPQYSDILTEHGITAYRGNPDHSFYGASENRIDRLFSRRAGRLIDTYFKISGSNVQSWEELYGQSFPLNVRASRFLRPWSSRLALLEPLKLHRIRKSIRTAAQTGSIFHLWWHPHNFASNLNENIRNLESILDEFSRCRDADGITSLNIGEITDIVCG